MCGEQTTAEQTTSTASSTFDRLSHQIRLSDISGTAPGEDSPSQVGPLLLSGFPCLNLPSPCKPPTSEGSLMEPQLPQLQVLNSDGQLTVTNIHLPSTHWPGATQSGEESSS